MSSVTCCPSTIFLIVSLMANVNFRIVASGSDFLIFNSSMAFPAIFLVLSSLFSMTCVSLIQRQNKALVVTDSDNDNNNSDAIINKNLLHVTSVDCHSRFPSSGVTSRSGCDTILP